MFTILLNIQVPIKSYIKSIQSLIKKDFRISVLVGFAFQFSAENGNEENPLIQNEENTVCVAGVLQCRLM